jgi:hypothetical protein
MTKPRKGNVPPATPVEAKASVDVIDDAIRRFEGNVDELEQAIGMYMVGRHVGWKVLVLVHNKRTIRKYEDILGINIREAFREEGLDAERSRAYRFASKLSNFWKAVSGDEPVPGRKEIVK